MSTRTKRYPIAPLARAIAAPFPKLPTPTLSLLLLRQVGCYRRNYQPNLRSLPLYHLALVQTKEWNGLASGSMTLPVTARSH
jgi:hypothetical protein